MFDACRTIFAQAADGAGAPPAYMTYFPLIIVGLMMFMFFRATSKQKKELQIALAAIKKNDKVVTSGGIIGVVVALKDNEDEITLKVDDTTNSRIRVLKSSVVKITSGDVTTGEVKTG